MGIKGLWKYFHETLDEAAYKRCRIEDFRDKTLLFDTKGLIYRLKFGHHGIAAYMGLFISIVRDCQKYNITPIFIMDGVPPPSKQFVNQKRKEQRIKTKEEIQEAQSFLKKKKLELGAPSEFTAQEILDSGIGIDEDQMESVFTMEEKLSKKIDGTVTVTDEDVGHVYFLLEKMGCWVLRSHGEGEALCSMMNRMGFGYAVVSEDSDCFPFGAKRIIRDWGVDKKEGTMKVYDCDQVLKDLNLDLDKIIEICILSGNDFDGGIKLKRFGFKTSLDNVQQYGTIENIIKQKTQESLGKKKPSFEIPEGYDPSIPRKEFYSYSKTKKLFSYIKIPDHLNWRPNDAISYFKANKLSILIPSYIQCFEKSTGNTIEQEFIQAREFNTKMPSPPVLTIEERELINQLALDEYESYQKKFIGLKLVPIVRKRKSKSISSNSQTEEEINYKDQLDDKFLTTTTTKVDEIKDSKDEKFIFLEEKIIKPKRKQSITIS